MKKSDMLREDREELIALCKRMTPEERLMAYLRHSQLAAKMCEAGVRYRSRRTKRPGKKHLESVFCCDSLPLWMAKQLRVCTEL